MAEVRKKVQVVRGLPFPPSKIFTKEKIEGAMDYMPRDEDIIISSYPKTGTTWLTYIVRQALKKDDLLPSWEDMEQQCLFMETVDRATLDALKPPRMFMRHIPYNMVRKNSNSKCLYIYRRPEDTIVSYYHFLTNMGRLTCDIDEFFEIFLNGELAFGRYFEHVLSYVTHKNEENLLLVSYEKLLEDRELEITRIANFLGQGTLTNKELDKIVKQTDFENMKKNISPSFPHLEDVKSVEFFRKGKAGDGRKSLNLEQLKRLKEITAEVMKGTSVVEEWIQD